MNILFGGQHMQGFIKMKPGKSQVKKATPLGEDSPYTTLPAFGGPASYNLPSKDVMSQLPPSQDPINPRDTTSIFSWNLEAKRGKVPAQHQ